MKAYITIVSLVLAFATASAQGPLQLSMQQALDLAARQSYQVQVSEIEAQKARERIKEVTAMGLPQINGSVSLQNYIDVPTQVVPNFFGGEPELIEVQFGVPWTANAGVRLDQLIFDGSYLLGLKAAREVRKQSDEDLERTIRDAKVQAAKAYYGVLAADEGARIMDESIPLLERSVNEIQVMANNGFVESIDVDRLQIELMQARDRKLVFERQAELARNFLRFVLGVPTGTPIELTDELDMLIESPAESALDNEPLLLEKHVEHRMASTMLRVQTLQMRAGRAAFLPSLGGFFAHQQQWNAIDLEPFNGPIPWFPATLWGVNLNIPIFSSGQRGSKLQQAKLGLAQAEVNLEATEERLRLEHLQRQNDLLTARDLYQSEKERMELAKNIWERTSLKFTEGLSSSFELTQEHGNFLMAQQTYIQSIVTLLQARADMRKALDMY